MDTLVLFSKHLNDEGCFCLKLNTDGVVSIPPAQHSFAEIKALQSDCDTLVIESAAHASILNIELPWLPERKARAAIPYALEEKLAQPVNELHFAFDKTRYQNNQYLIVVISKQRIRFIMQVLTAQKIEFSAITLDWLALEPEEFCVSESTLLVNMNDFKGALSGELAETYLKNHITQQPLLFSDSKIKPNHEVMQNKESSYAWITTRILKSRLLNLCQGEMQHESKSDWIKKGYQIAAALGGLWLLSLITVNAINLYFLNKETTKIDKQIAVIYRQFFPDAKQVISPKFRITQLLKNNNSEEQNRFWFLLNQLSKVINSEQFTIEQLHYQNKILSITLVSADFANLEKLENELRKSQLNIKQTQASTREQQVIATLELS
ncbi:MAG: type II secretion system protein GspL [Legionella sp.]|uniref:type II secretion system protein GspL n=1 Tax=Legionella sp. TaxID=459 RepID=UPI0039E24EDE